MPTNKEISYLLSLRDEASAVFKKYEQIINDGVKQISGSMGDLGKETDKYGKSTDGLSEFIRKNRAEQREQNFLFRQGKDVVGAASVALALFSNTQGQTEGKTKAMTDALNKGFVTFQGLDFLLAGVGGPWGIAAATIGGLASTVLTLAKNNEEATKTLREQHIEIGKIIDDYNEWQAKLHGNSEANRKVSEEEAKLLQARLDALNQVVDAQKKGGKEIQLILNDINLSLAQQTAFQVEAGAAAKRSVADNVKELKTLKEQYDAVTAAAREMIIEGNKPAAESIDDLRQKVNEAEKEVGKYTDRSEEQLIAIDKLRNAKERLAAAESYLAQTLDTLNGIQAKSQLQLGGIVTQAEILRNTLSSLSSGPSLSDIFKLPDIPRDVFDKNVFFPVLKASDILPEATLDELRLKIESIQQELAKTGIDTPGFDKLQIELDRLKNKMEGALTSPLQKFQNSWQQIAPIVNRAFSLISQASSQNSQTLIGNIENEKETRLKAIDDQLKQEKLGEKEKANLLAQRQSLELNYDNKLRAAKREAFESEKQARTLESIMNTAEEITKVLATPWMIPIVAALGAIQTSIISSQPTPRFHQGSGGPVLFDAPASREMPIIIRGGETFEVKTEQQRSSGAGITLVINIGTVADDEAFKRVIQRGMEKLGVTDVNKYFQNNRSKLILA